MKSYNAQAQLDCNITKPLKAFHEKTRFAPGTISMRSGVPIRTVESAFRNNNIDHYNAEKIINYIIGCNVGIEIPEHLHDLVEDKSKLPKQQPIAPEVSIVPSEDKPDTQILGETSKLPEELKVTTAIDPVELVSQDRELEAEKKDSIPSEDVPEVVTSDKQLYRFQPIIMAFLIATKKEKQTQYTLSKVSGVDQSTIGRIIFKDIAVRFKAADALVKTMNRIKPGSCPPISELIVSSNSSKILYIIAPKLAEYKKNSAGGKTSVLVSRLGLSSSYAYALLAGKPIGEKAAIEILEKTGIPYLLDDLRVNNISTNSNGQTTPSGPTRTPVNQQSFRVHEELKCFFHDYDMSVDQIASVTDLTPESIESLLVYGSTTTIEHKTRILQALEDLKKSEYPRQTNNGTNPLSPSTEQKNDGPEQQSVPVEKSDTASDLASNHEDNNHRLRPDQPVNSPSSGYGSGGSFGSSPHSMGLGIRQPSNDMFLPDREMNTDIQTQRPDIVQRLTECDDTYTEGQKFDLRLAIKSFMAQEDKSPQYVARVTGLAVKDIDDLSLKGSTADGKTAIQILSALRNSRSARNAKIDYLPSLASLLVKPAVIAPEEISTPVPIISELNGNSPELNGNSHNSNHQIPAVPGLPTLQPSVPFSNDNNEVATPAKKYELDSDPKPRKANLGTLKLTVTLDFEIGIGAETAPEDVEKLQKILTDLGKLVAGIG